MKTKEQPLRKGGISLMKQEYVKGGLMITHPSGKVAMTTLEDLHKIRQVNQGYIDMLQQQERIIDGHIEKVKAAQKV